MGERDRDDYADVGPESNVEDLNDDLRCPACGSVNIERDDPRPGEHTCRDCGGWLDD